MGSMAVPLALLAGKDQIDVFADGSFQELISVGSWAFYAPDPGLENAGIGTGPGIEHFEITAALAGVEAILRVDRTTRPIHVFTDADVCMLLFEHAAERKKLPNRPAFQKSRHLFDRAVHLLAQRRITVTKIGSGSTPEHKHCHQLASGKRRSGIAADPALRKQLAMRMDEQRLNAIQKQQKDLRRKLVALGKQALVIQARWLEVDQQSPAALAATAGGDMELFAKFAQQIRQAAAEEVLDALDVLWTEDDLKIRRLFKLPVSRDLWNFSLEKALGSTDIPETLEPEEE